MNRTSMEFHGKHVVVLPYPGRGHINPMLNLCQNLTAHGLLVTVVVTEEWLKLLSEAKATLEKEVRLRTIPDVLPSESKRGADFATFIEAVLTKMAGPVAELINGGLEKPVDFIVADSMLPWAVVLGKRLGVPVFAFFPQSVAVFVALLKFDLAGNEFMKYLPRPSSFHFTDFMSDSNGRKTLKTFIQGISWFSMSQGLLFNSYTVLETKAFSNTKCHVSVPIYSIGPSILKLANEEVPTENYYEFLDSQPKNSVLYVSLGSFLPVSGEHMKEIAMGLAMSGHPFIWSLRNSEHVEEWIGDKGMIVPWCDQVRVLCHPSVGGFLSHCGWNSTLESIHAAVPMLTYPLMWDQFPNSRLIVDEWKVGLRAKDEKEEDIVKSEAIAKVVQRLMNLETEESKELRGRAKELQEKSHAALTGKCSSSSNVNAFANDILKWKHSQDGSK